MKTKTTIVALLSAAAFVAVSAPTQALEAPAATGWLVTIDHTGNIAVEEAVEPSGDAVVDCQGTAPQESACTLRGFTNAGWTVGWYLPGPIPGTPVTASVQSTRVSMTGTSTSGALVFECNWTANSLGVSQLPAVACRIINFVLPFGSLTASFTTGAYNLQGYNPALPSTHEVPAGVGHWHAVLITY